MITDYELLLLRIKNHKKAYENLIVERKEILKRYKAEGRCSFVLEFEKEMLSRFETKLAALNELTD